ncbi:MAG: hypothetical protein ABFS41_11495, partial [Myxococcota bacterium]
MRKRFNRWQRLLCWLLAWQLVGLHGASPAFAERRAARQDADGLCVDDVGSQSRASRRKTRDDAVQVCADEPSGEDGGASVGLPGPSLEPTPGPLLLPRADGTAREFAASLCADDSSDGDGGGPVCPIDLGAAAECRILQLGGGDVSLAGRPGAVTGDVCIGPATRGRTQLNLVGQQVLTGDIHLAPGARLNQRKKASFQGAVHHDADLAAALGDAALADEAVTAAPCIELGNVTGSRTLCGMGGLNVFCADSIALGKGEVLRLDGGPEDSFVVKVAGSLTLKGGARIVAGQDLPPEHVLFHAQGRGKPVGLKGGRGAASSLDGTVLAPERRVHLVRSTLQGSVVSGNGI